MEQDQGASAASWWISRDEEHCVGPYETRDAAVQVGTNDFDGDAFYVMRGKRMKLRAPSFDDWFGEAFDDRNEDYADPDGYGFSDSWDDAAYKALCQKVDATVAEWLVEHRYDEGWALDLEPSERIPAVAESDAPNPSISPVKQQGG